MSQVNQEFAKRVNQISTQSEDNTQDKLIIGVLNECRICLQSKSQQNSKMLSPCKCTGSLKYVHDFCIQQWICKIINKSNQKISSGKAYISCQICQDRICFKTTRSIICKTKQQIVSNFKQNIKTFVLLMLLFLTNFSFFSALLYYLLFVGYKTLITNNVVLVSLIISGMVIFSIVSVVTLACIINKYFLTKKFLVFQIQGRQQKIQNKKQKQQKVQGHEQYQQKVCIIQNSKKDAQKLQFMNQTEQQK